MSNIRRPRPSPRQGRRLGPPQVWNLSFLATGIPRPHPWLFMGVQACRLPALKRSKPLKPLKGHFHGFLWASSAGKSYPKARSIAVSGRSSVPFARHSQPTGIRRPLQWPKTLQTPKTPGHCNGFLWASSASMAFYGRPSLPFARPKTLQTLQTPKTPKRQLQWLLMGFQRRQKPTSMAFYGRPSLPFARPKTLSKPLKSP